MGEGTNKLALQVGERSLGSIALQTALQSKLDHVFVVTKGGRERSGVD